MLLTRGTPAAGTAAVLTARLWDLPALRSRLVLLATETERAIELLAGGDRTVLPETFIISVAVTRALSAEPRLPDELTGPAWPADPLRERYGVLARRHGRALGAALGAMDPTAGT